MKNEQSSAEGRTQAAVCVCVCVCEKERLMLRDHSMT